MANYWNLDEVEFLKNNYSNMKNDKIAKHLNRTVSSVVTKAIYLKLKKSNEQKWSKDDIDILVSNYNTMPINELKTLLNRTVASIRCKANDLSITNNVIDKDRGNLGIFNKICNEESAYWLGFVYADGWVRVTDRNAELGIELSAVDIDHLFKFSKIFNDYYKVSTFIKSTGKSKGLKMCRIRVYNRDLVNSLISINVVPCKTTRKEFPVVKDEIMFFHFLRGFVDGDGSFYIKKTKSSNGNIHAYPRVKLTGNNRDFLEYISLRLKEYSINSTIIKDRNNFILSIDNSNDYLKLVKLLYKDSNIYLNRKYEKVKEIMNLAVLNRNI